MGKRPWLGNVWDVTGAGELGQADMGTLCQGMTFSYQEESQLSRPLEIPHNTTYVPYVQYEKQCEPSESRGTYQLLSAFAPMINVKRTLGRQALIFHNHGGHLRLFATKNFSQLNHRRMNP